MTTNGNIQARDGQCVRCRLGTDRRGFLGGVALTLTALALDGMWPDTAHALPIAAAHVISSTPQEVTYPVLAADGVQIDKTRDVILVRHMGSMYAFALNCPHQNTALRWNDKNSQFQCPKHKSKYQPDGTFISGRATRAMDRFALRKEGATLVVDLTKLYQQDDDASGWEAAKVTL